MADGIDFLALVGTWQGTVRTWLDPNGDPLVNDISGIIRAAPGNASVIHDYTSAVGENISNGSMIIGRDIATNRDALTWVDSFHTGGGLMQFASADGSFHGSYAAGTEMWRWRITFALSGDELRIDHVNVTPDSKEARAIEVRYQRRATLPPM